jgi:hypothetical protein
MYNFHFILFALLTEVFQHLRLLIRMPSGVRRDTEGGFGPLSE